MKISAIVNKYQAKIFLFEIFNVLNTSTDGFIPNMIFQESHFLSSVGLQVNIHIRFCGRYFNLTDVFLEAKPQIYLFQPTEGDNRCRHTKIGRSDLIYFLVNTDQAISYKELCLTLNRIGILDLPTLTKHSFRIIFNQLPKNVTVCLLYIAKKDKCSIKFIFIK